MSNFLQGQDVKSVPENSSNSYEKNQSNTVEAILIKFKERPSETYVKSNNTHVVVVGLLQ